MYYRARYYDPSVGRFTQRDPIGIKGGINLYAYVRNDPVNQIDPEGERPLTAGEVTFLSLVFNNTVNYDQIDIQSGVSVDPRTWGPIAIGAAVTLENTINFPASGYQSDFSSANLVAQSWLVHEVAHVYQYQNNSGYNWLWAAVEGLRSDTYEYELDFSMTLTDYRFEQQASLLADYYRALVTGSPSTVEFESIIGPYGLGNTIQNTLCGACYQSLSTTTETTFPYSGNAESGYNWSSSK